MDSEAKNMKRNFNIFMIFYWPAKYLKSRVDLVMRTLVKQKYKITVEPFTASFYKLFSLYGILFDMQNQYEQWSWRVQ